MQLLLLQLFSSEKDNNIAKSAISSIFRYVLLDEERYHWIEHSDVIALLASTSSSSSSLSFTPEELLEMISNNKDNSSNNNNSNGNTNAEEWKLHLDKTKDDSNHHYHLADPLLSELLSSPDFLNTYSNSMDDLLVHINYFSEKMSVNMELVLESLGYIASHPTSYPPSPPTKQVMNILIRCAHHSQIKVRRVATKSLDRINGYVQ